MDIPIVVTKLYIPPLRENVVLRPHLVERMNEGLRRKLTLVSAHAGFGKTTLLSEFVSGRGHAVSWFSLDEGDNDPARFWSHFIAALQMVVPNIGEEALITLQSPQLPTIESILTSLLNEIATIPNDFLLVLDDYHAIDSKPTDAALAFLIERLPPQMHLSLLHEKTPTCPWRACAPAIK